MWPSFGREMARRGEFRHAVGTADRAPETCGESVDHRGRDRRAAGIEMDEAVEMRARRAPRWFISAMNAVIAPMMKVGRCSRNASSADLRLEAIGQDQRGARRKGRDHLRSRSR